MMCLLNVSKLAALSFRIRSTLGVYSKGNAQKSFATLPDKLNKSMTEKWRIYWEDLLKDYTDVLKETFENGKKTPRKTLFLCSLLGFTVVCFKTNPDELNYRDKVTQCSNDVLLVSKPIRNPDVDQFLTSIESCYNLGLLRRMSLGAVSFMWIDNYTNELGQFKAKCSYLKPQYTSFVSRIVDVGFLGKWWCLDKYMQDYDINPKEWSTLDTVDS